MDMDMLIWIGCLCLLVVFAVAGVAKLRDIDQAREGLMGFGVPKQLARPATVLLASSELLTAALFIHPATRLAGALGALALLAMFTLAITAQLLRGRRPMCACFGALTQSAISWKSIARNVLLMAVAIALIVSPMVDEAAAPTISLPVLGALVWFAVSASWLLLLTRQNGRLLLRIEQLERNAVTQPTQSVPTLQPLQAGDAVPPLRLSDARGRPFDLHSLRGQPVLVLFLDAACSHCRSLLTQLRDAPPSQAEATLIVISENEALRPQLPAGVKLLIDPGWGSTTPLFGLRGTPAALSIAIDGTLTQTLVHGISAVRAAIDRIAPSDPVNTKVEGEEVHHELAAI